MKKSLILIAHGSKNKTWGNSLENVYGFLKKKAGSNYVQLSYLEFSRPTLEEALNNAVKADYQEIIILPMFIANGNHTKKDIPQKINLFKKLNKKIKVKLLPTIGEHKEVINLYKKLLKGYLKS